MQLPLDNRYTEMKSLCATSACPRLGFREAERLPKGVQEAGGCQRLESRRVKRAVMAGTGLRATGDDEAVIFAFGGSLHDEAGDLCDSSAVVDGGGVVGKRCGLP